MRHILFGYHPDWTPEIARWLDRTCFQPSFAPFDRVDLAAYDLIVPLTLADYEPLRRQSAPVRAVIPDAATVALCDDKLAFGRWLAQRGLSSLAPAILDGPPSYPHIRKARHGEFGVGCRIVHGAWDDLDAWEPDQYFRQEVIPGPLEYALHLLRVDGRTWFSRAFCYDMGEAMTVRGGEHRPLSCHAVDADAVTPACERLLEALDYQGTCCINYKIAGGKLKILEINPRFGGSLVTDVTRYVDAYLASFDAG